MRTSSLPNNIALLGRLNNCSQLKDRCARHCVVPVRERGRTRAFRPLGRICCTYNDNIMSNEYNIGNSRCYNGIITVRIRFNNNNNNIYDLRNYIVCARTLQ